MSIEPMGMIGGIAGSPLAQVHGGDVEKTARVAADEARRLESARHAEQAAGIGTTQQDEQISDRDGDGRRLWRHSDGADADARQPPSPPATPDHGGRLDVSG